MIKPRDIDEEVRNIAARIHRIYRPRYDRRGDERRLKLVEDEVEDAMQMGRMMALPIGGW